ncbi:hypothetical protein FACS1894186_8180 [Alphaproteobacteria bacterium]|nr:hypothetical protein FACS1894186_8180 [Alphaproteobacteria bacterium]
MVALLALAGCGGSGKSTYYWRNDGTGSSRFAADHASCMADADKWPFTMPRVPTQPEVLNLRLRQRDNAGVWAQYSPHAGAQPLYVNYAAGDWSVNASNYNVCMRKRGYAASRHPYVGKEVGVADCDARGRCRNPPYIQ